MQLWQLKKISTGEALSEPQLLPDNWGPIFGLSGFEDRLGDLSWLGKGYVDQGWFKVDYIPKEVVLSIDELKEVVNKQIESFIQATNEYVLPDNPTMTKSKLQEWMLYRKMLREIPYQVGFPTSVEWPKRPD